MTSPSVIDVTDEEGNIIPYERIEETEDSPATTSLFTKAGNVRPEYRTTFSGRFFSIPQIMSVVGSTRAGKGVFGGALAEKFQHYYPNAKNNVYWIVLPHMVKAFQRYLPKGMHAYSDFLEALPSDEEINAPGYSPQPKLFIFDEISRIFNQYDYRDLYARVLGNFCALHGHHRSWIIFLDQSRAHIKEARVREHAWGYLALSSEELVNILQRSEPLLRSILQHPMIRQQVIKNGSENKTTLRKPTEGYGRIFIATIDYKIYESQKFLRPAWYTKEASEVGAMISNTGLVEMSLKQHQSVILEQCLKVPEETYTKIINFVAENCGHILNTRTPYAFQRIRGLIYREFPFDLNNNLISKAIDQGIAKYFDDNPHLSGDSPFSKLPKEVLEIAKKASQLEKITISNVQALAVQLTNGAKLNQPFDRIVTAYAKELCVSSKKHHKPK